MQEHDAKPVLVGSQLRNLSDKNHVIYIRNAVQVRVVSGTLFKECIQEITITANDGM